MRVGALTAVSPLAAPSSRTRLNASAAICRNGTRTVVSGTGSLLTTGMSL